MKNEENIKILREEIDKMRRVIAEMDARVNSIDEKLGRISGLQDVLGIRSEVAQLSKQVEALRKRIESLEEIGVVRVQPEKRKVGNQQVQIAVSEEEARKQIAYARELMVNGEVDKAIDVLNSLVMRGYTSYELVFTLGDAFFRKEDYRSAIRQWLIIVNDEDKLKGNEIVPRTYLRLANAFLRIGDTKNARLMLEAIISKYPQSPEAKTASGMLKDIK